MVQIESVRSFSYQRDLAVAPEAPAPGQNPRSLNTVWRRIGPSLCVCPGSPLAWLGVSGVSQW